MLRLVEATFEALPRQQKLIAQYLTSQSERIMVERISDIAHACGVQPSAIVRFCQRLGFSGFSEMQALFREAYTNKTSPAQSYTQRIRNVIANKSERASSADLAEDCIDATLAGIHRLKNELDEAIFDQAVDMVVAADSIHVIGARRSFAVADYLVYSLRHTDKRVNLVTGLGASFLQEVRSVRRDDLVIAVSFSPYAEETQFYLAEARERGAKVLVVTDSNLSPLASLTDAVLLVNEGASFAFRSLSATMCLCQALFIAVAYRLELNVDHRR
ncbi:putative HTH-type transcriptional regulator YbbH [compost metagenome]